MTLDFFRQKRLLILLFVLFLTANCGGNATSETGLAAPVLMQTSQSPDSVVRAFLDAWNTGDYEAMFRELSPQSQSFYTLPVFQQIYQDANTAISISGLTYAIEKTDIQGASAAVTYNLQLESPVFGTIEDDGRLMRLVQKPGGWGIAWSSMDIFDGLAAGSRLQVSSRRQPRGTILDRNGLPLVENGGTLTPMYSSQQNMPSVDDCLNLLASVLMRQRYDLAEYFAGYNPETIFYLGSIDTATQTARGQELQDTCAANIISDYAGVLRNYPLGSGAVHLIGYVGQIQPEQLSALTAKGYVAGDLVGQAGIEQAYEEPLAGQSAKVLQIISSSGIVLRELAGREGSDPVSVKLTVDRELQRAAGRALVDAFNYAEPNWASPGIATGAGIVVIDVNTGGILAMSSYPSYDPHVFNPDSPIENRGILISDYFNDTRQPLRNRPVQEQYFPGSTFKIITLAAALSEGVAPANFDCQLTWDGRELGDTSSPRFDWRRFEPEESPVSQATGPVTPYQALAASCNPFFYQMGVNLYQKGPSLLTEYARRMGLGVVTGLGATFGEAAGVIPAPSAVEQGINEAIGQGGMQVTILQMARMTAGVANGGTLYRPYLVQQVGEETPTEPLAVADMQLSDEVLNTIRQGMCTVTTVENLGTAWFVFEETGYTVCGKTGTAQSGRQQPYGWFVAYAPAENPQIAVAAMVEFSREGSETAAPIVRRVLDAYFQQPAWGYPEWWQGEYVPLESPSNANYTGG